MDPVDNAAPNVDFSDQQDLAGVVQSYRFLSILIGLAVVLFVVGKFGMDKSAEGLANGSECMYCFPYRLVAIVACQKQRQKRASTWSNRVWQIGHVFPVT